MLNILHIINDELITKITTEIDNLRKSFQAGCKKIVDALTALGGIVAHPQGPDEIVAGMNNLIDDIKKNPEKYGIKTGLDYSATISSTNYPGIRVRSWGTGNGGDPSLDVHDQKTYNVPLKSSNGQSLYGINISLSASHEAASTASASFYLKTVEGVTLYADTVEAEGRITKNRTVFCDLLAKNFSTSADYLILRMDVSAHTLSGNTDGSGLNQSGYADISDAVAKYK